MSEPNSNTNLIEPVGDLTILETPKKARRHFWKSVVRNFARLCKLAGHIPCVVVSHIIKKIWVFIRKNKDPNTYENFQTLKQVLKTKYPEDLVFIKSVYRNIKEYALKLWNCINTEAKLWNIIKYVPILNIIYGTGRIVHYIILYCKTNDADRKDEYRKEIIRSLTTIVGGLLAILLVSPFSAVISMLPGVILSYSTKFAVEMMAGAFIQNLFIFVGEIFSTPFAEVKGMTIEAWEKQINNEIFMKTPFIGAVYSYLRAVVYLLKGDLNEGLLSLADGVINGLWSFGMLGVSVSVHPSFSNTPLYKWLNRQLCDDLARTFTLLGKTITPKVVHDLIHMFFKCIVTFLQNILEYSKLYNSKIFLG